MFSTTGQEVKKGGGSKSFNAGVVYAHIFDAVVKTASTGKKQLQITLEGPAIAGFEGWDIDRNDASKGKFAGQSSVISGTIYMDDSKFNSSDLNVNEIMGKLVTVADELGLRTEIDAITGATTIEEWVAKAVTILKNQNLYFFLTGTEELYNGKTIVKLQLPKFKYASVDKTKLDEFDKTNKYHYKALASTPALAGAPVSEFEAAPFDIA